MLPTPEERLAIRLDAIEGKLDLAITRLEDHKRVVDGFDDRIALLRAAAEGLQQTSRSLADATMRLHAEKRLQFWAAIIATAIAASISTAWAHDALAKMSAGVHTVEIGGEKR